MKTHILWHTDNKANISLISSLDFEIKKEESPICAQESLSRLLIQLCWLPWLDLWIK